MRRVTGGWDTGVETVRHPRFPHAMIVARIGCEVEYVFGDKFGKTPSLATFELSQQVARDIVELHFGGVPWHAVRYAFEQFEFPNLAVLDLNACYLDQHDVHLLYRLLSASSRSLRSLDLSHNRKIGHLLNFQLAIRQPIGLRRISLRDMFWDGEDLFDTVKDIARSNANVQYIDISGNRRPFSTVHALELDRLLGYCFRRVERGYLRDTTRIKHTGMKKIGSVGCFALKKRANYAG